MVEHVSEQYQVKQVMLINTFVTAMCRFAVRLALMHPTSHDPNELHNPPVYPLAGRENVPRETTPKSRLHIRCSARPKCTRRHMTQMNFTRNAYRIIHIVEHLSPRLPKRPSVCPPVHPFCYSTHPFGRPYRRLLPVRAPVRRPAGRLPSRPSPRPPVYPLAGRENVPGDTT